MRRPSTVVTPRWVELPVLFVVAGLAVAVLPGSAEAQAGQYENLDRFEEECAPEEGAEAEEESRLSASCRPLAEIPDRPRPLLEIGAPFLGTGVLGNGFRIPGGAVWQPALLAFGTLRTSVQGRSISTDAGGENTLAEAVGRFDLFGNLYLTQTERVVVGLRPLDQDGRFTRYTFTDPLDEEFSEEGEFVDELNGTVQTLFFEGDLASLFPFLDRNDTRGLDIYFSVGRQALGMQDGMLLNEDQLDMVGLTKANMKIGSTVNTRVTLVYGWGEVSRQASFGNADDEEASLFGLFSEIDFRSSTVEVDVAYVTGDEVTGDGLHAGISDVRRIGRFNNTFRVLGSFPMGDETPFNSQGVLIHEQFGWTPHHSHNWWYVNAFAGIGEFRSAARGPGAGGPVGQTGVLFSAPGIGRVGSALGSQSDNAVGASVGHQMFFSDSRRQLLLEVGGRVSTDSDIEATLVGGGARYQMAMGRRWVLVLDGTAGYDTDAGDTQAAGRFELVLKL